MPPANRHLLRVVLITALTLPLGCRAGGESSCANSTDAACPLPPAQVQREVQQAVKSYAEAMNRADVSTLLGLYAHTPDVTSVGDGDVTRGWEPIRAETDSSLTGTEGAIRVSLGSIDVTPLGARHALALAPYTLAVATTRGTAQLRGAMTFVFQRADSGWQIIHEHSSTAGQ